MSDIEKKMKISVAAVPYFWSKDSYFDFYLQLAESQADIIYLGETVCSKRRSMRFQDWLTVAAMLNEAGKQVVLSTLTLLEAESELNYLKKIASQKTFLIEANDFSAVEIASQQELKFVSGCAINLYNLQSFNRLSDLGMVRWSIPVELGRDDLLPLLETARSKSIELEYQVFGRMPLAYSARCFTARHHQLDKDNCQFKCSLDEQGILVNTQEGEPFAQINGIQTQSAKTTQLIEHLSEIEKSGIDIARIVPICAQDTIEVVSQISKINDGKQSKFHSEKLRYDYSFCNGYWFQIEGMKLVV